MNPQQPPYPQQPGNAGQQFPPARQQQGYGNHGGYGYGYGQQPQQAYRQPDPYQYENRGAPPPPSPPARNGMGTAALVLGIMACILAFVPILGFISYPLAILGIVFGLMGIARAGRGAATNRGMAIAGMVTSALGLVLVIVSTVLYVGAINAGVQSVNKSLNATHNVTYKVSSTNGGKVVVSYSSGAAGIGTQTDVASPWTQDAVVTGSFATLTASTGFDIDNPRKQEGITCSITDKDTGKVLVSNTVPPSGSATVSCNASNFGG